MSKSRDDIEFAGYYFDEVIAMANDYERLQNIRSAQREEIQDLKKEIARLKEWIEFLKD